jgi:hypothetical protein
VTPHTHPDARYVTVLAGEVYSGMGDTVNEKRRSAFQQEVSSSCRPDTYIIPGLKMAKSPTKNRVSDPLQTPTSRNSPNRYRG